MWSTMEVFLTQPMDPEKKRFELIYFPYEIFVIPKSLVSLAIGQVSFLSF